MKQLSTVLKDMQLTATELEKRIKTVSDGYAINATKEATKSPKQIMQVKKSNSLATMQNQATRIRSTVQTNAPKKLYKWIDTENGKKQIEEIKKPNLTEDQELWIAQAQAPAPQDFIIDWLTRLAAHKRLHNDEESQVVRFVDYSDTIYGSTEYAVILGIIEIINENDGEWFPTLKEIKDKINSFEVSYD